MTVQYLLNCVPTARGGPPQELKADGIIGPETLSAIVRFQIAVGATADGRVAPGSQTLARLQPFDPLPDQALTTTGVTVNFNPKELSVDKAVPWSHRPP